MWSTVQSSSLRCVVLRPDSHSALCRRLFSDSPNEHGFRRFLNQVRKAARNFTKGTQENGGKQPKKPRHGKPRGEKPFDIRTLGRWFTTPRGMLYSSGSAIALYCLFLSTRTSVEKEMLVQDMIKQYLVRGYIARIDIENRTRGIVHLRTSAPEHYGGQTIVVEIGSPEQFEAKLESVQNELGLQTLERVPIRYVTKTEWIRDIILPFAPHLLFLAPLLFLMRSSRGSTRNMFNMGKVFPAGAKDVTSKTKFSDVAGLTEAKQEVMEFVDFLKDASKFERLGAKIPKGALLVGPPGTGKTLLAKAIAGEAECSFFSMSGSDFMEMYVGVGSSRVRDLFEKARKNSPSIVFIDEIDVVGGKRGGGVAGAGGNDERESTLNQLLVEMDGFKTGGDVVVLASTNRADILDPALLRPGRFDRQIDIQRPDITERAAIFKVHLKPIRLVSGLGMEEVAHRLSALTPGFVGSDIANICNEAAIFAARRNSEAVAMVDFERASERVMAGLPKSNSLMSKQNKRTVAVHESGHAVAGWFLKHADPLLKVTIVPRSKGSLGFAQYLPSEEGLYPKSMLQDRIAVTLGGRAAEELFMGTISSGAHDDLKKVTDLAYNMVSQLGMNKNLGLLSFASEQAFTKPYSEATGTLIDKEVQDIVKEQYDRVRKILTEKKDILLALSDRLEEKETLLFAELTEIMGKRPFGVQEEYREFVEQTNPFSVPEGSAPSDMKKSV